MKTFRLNKIILIRGLTVCLGFILIATFLATGAVFFLSSTSPLWKSQMNQIQQRSSSRHTDAVDRIPQSAQFNFKLDPDILLVRNVHATNSVSGSVAPKPVSSGSESGETCNMHNCFDIYRCTGQGHLSIYVYPFERFVLHGAMDPDPVALPISREFYEIIAAIVQSPYYTSDPNQACIFVPSIDLLNLDRSLGMGLDHGGRLSMMDIRDILRSLDHWGGDGSNHLLFTLGDSALLLNVSGSALVAGSEFSADSRQLGFKIPILFPNPLLTKSKSEVDVDVDLDVQEVSKAQKYSLIYLGAKKSTPKSLQGDKSILFLDFCPKKLLNYHVRCSGASASEVTYPRILTTVDFCLITSNLYPTLYDIMSAGCIPVLLIEKFSLPFEEIVDWRKNAILINEIQLTDLSRTLAKVSPERRSKLRAQIRATFDQRLKSVRSVTETLFEVLKTRVFSYSGRPRPDWSSGFVAHRAQVPILDPVLANRRLGFTAIILAYERLQSLFQVIERLRLVPSLSKILVIWNNQVQSPPPLHLWPNISKPIKVIRTTANRLSNRFFPYDEIQTEAVLSLDDDIIMLTPDEVEFGFQTWTEYADRLVGFPSRTHVWDNLTSRWRYESEWTNRISMVLTGAAFYHKYYHHAYWHEMPAEVRSWVDAKRNCEDIAMNFLIAASSGKGPIKVSPKKKFKCPTCSNNEMLSADTGHMVERTECINQFVKVYGYMPLVEVEFRADPVLFKLGLPKKMTRFVDVGSL